MLNYYLYLVVKEQTDCRKQDPPFPYAGCVGVALGLLLCTAGNTLQEGWDFSPSAPWWSAQKTVAKNVSLGGYLLKISNINNIYSHYNVPLATSALSSFPKLPRNAIRIWQRQWRSTIVPCLVFMALGECPGAPLPCFVMTEIHWQQGNSSSLALSQNRLQFTPKANFPLFVVGSPLRISVDYFEETLEAEKSIP